MDVWCVYVCMYTYMDIYACKHMPLKHQLSALESEAKEVLYGCVVYVCMYVYMYIDLLTFMYVCVYIELLTYMYVCVYVDTSI